MNTSFSDLKADFGAASFNKQAQHFILKNFNQQLFSVIRPQLGGFIEAETIGISVLSSQYPSDNQFVLKCSVFYQEKVGGCNCLDDPYSENGYFEAKFQLKPNSFTLLA